ncbi:LEA type 2 family protein [Thioalkalivibrio paradoxus]|uniref:Water stress and hypersensitive response domain-containing protein n=1 Tax=Thioalkalivibrio paradoxus ARh 1 TaxID=713585 RepID=W0DM74_9GAMM|nr:LEA type 2 family protein [Thioalkalivibrio paradoxus]AHE97990.1 hypothetical protein THITH_06685 [Thioalkalivibrio paradoxus ARh 1]
MLPSRRLFLFAATAALAAGCAGVRPGYEQPSLMLDSFRAVPSEGLSPRFAIGLRVVNPNPSALPLRGMSYNVEFEGHRLITGVAGDLSSVPAYGESVIEVQAGLDLLSGVRLFNDLLSDPHRERFRYNLRARLDTGGLRRFLTLEEAGELSLAALGR